MRPQGLRKISILGAFGFLAVAALACGLIGPTNRPSVKITDPADGSRVTVGQAVNVQAEAADGRGVARIELWVDGSMVISQTSPGQQRQPTLKAALAWQPQTAGAHIVEAQAYNLDDVSSKPFSIRLTAMEGKQQEKPTAAISSTQVITAPAEPGAGQTPGACQDAAVFLTDITIPDGTTFAPGAIFDKTWRIRNNGTCTWVSGYKLAFFEGEQMGGPTEVDLPPCAPQEVVDVTVKLRAPTEPGHYVGRWHPHNTTGVIFPGILTVVINVKEGAESAPAPQSQGPLPVIRYFRAEPQEIAPGESARLLWDLEGASGGAYLSPGGEKGIVAPGQMTVTPEKTTTYQLLARNSAGETKAEVTVKVK